MSTIITGLCVFQVDRERRGLTLTELAEGVEVEKVRKTGAEFRALGVSLEKMAYWSVVECR